MKKYDKTKINNHNNTIEDTVLHLHIAVHYETEKKTLSTSKLPIRNYLGDI